MSQNQFKLLSNTVAIWIVVIIAIRCSWAAAPLSFDYEQGQTVPDDKAGARTHEVKLDPATGQVFVYATFEMGQQNPIATTGEQPQGRQFVTLGQTTVGKLVPAVRFGVRESIRERGFLTTYLSDGQLEYYGMWLRPNTPYDFKLQLDLANGRMTAWCSGHGDDNWYLLVADAPLMNAVTEISQVKVRQTPGAAGVRQLLVRSEPLPAAERVQPHPLDKPNRMVGAGYGFKLQSMRSTWSLADRRVTVCRKQGLHFAFPDVSRSGPTSLVCIFDNVSHSSGASRGVSITTSHDLGQTWSEPKPSPGSGWVQKLKDGTLLLFADKSYYSNDGGTSWAKLAFTNRQNFGGLDKVSQGLSGPITELPDGSWLSVSSGTRTDWTPQNCEQFVEAFRSTDRGQTWKFLSSVESGPLRSNNEATSVVLKDGRVLLFARDDRSDGFPGIKAFSRDNGQSWEPQELPFAIQGRTDVGMLRDGRVMVTFRSMFKGALWAWIGDPDDATPYRAVGVHFNDKQSVGLKYGALHIDNDGVCGQFTQYFLRQPDSLDTKIDVTVEVKVLSSQGRTATLSVPHVGKLRFFPDRVELVHDTSDTAKWTTSIAPDKFHTYRVIRDGDRATVHVDGKLALDTDQVDGAVMEMPYTPVKEVSVYRLAFGNESERKKLHSRICDSDISLGVTGHAIWRMVKVVQEDPLVGRYENSWLADRDGFPDQHQLDHIIEIGASIAGNDQGYSGWVQLDDGRIFVVDYTDDGAPINTGPQAGHQARVWPRLGITWIRGTYLLPSDLPPSGD